MYNSTAYTITGKTPSELFFRTQFRDKIPSSGDMNTRIDDSEVRDRDEEQKGEGNKYTNRKRRAAENKICIGGKVYVKHISKSNKLSSNLDPTPHTVEISREVSC